VFTNDGIVLDGLITLDLFKLSSQVERILVQVMGRKDISGGNV
jgi:hypothetical protein